MAKPTVNKFKGLAFGAEYLGVSEATVRRYISAGLLPGYRVGGTTIRVKVEDLEALAERIPTSAGI